MEGNREKESERQGKGDEKRERKKVKWKDIKKGFGGK